MCCGNGGNKVKVGYSTVPKMFDGNYNLTNTNTSPSQGVFSGPNCPDFPGTTPCTSDIVFKCYNQTGCFDGRQLSSTIFIPGSGTSYSQYKVLAISDANGGYYNVPSQSPVDLNISVYKQNSHETDWQMCGYGGFNPGDSTILAGGQSMWFCQDSSYYIGVNSGDTVNNISTTQFYVCLQFQTTQAGGSSVFTINDLGTCRTHDCERSSSGK